MKPALRKFVVIPGILLSAFALMAVLSQFKPEPPKQENENLDLLVDTLTLEQSTENFKINSQGTVRPRTQTVLSAEVSGSIVSISPNFIAGGAFEKGEVLMQIDPTAGYDELLFCPRPRRFLVLGTRPSTTLGVRFGD